MISCGVFHLKYMSTKLYEYWKYQAQSDLPLELPNPNAISLSITRERHWEPHLYILFIQDYKLHAFYGVAIQTSLAPTAPNFVPTEPGHGAPFRGPTMYPGREGGGVGGDPDGN